MSSRALNRGRRDDTGEPEPGRPVWLRPEPRTRRPRYSRAKIAAAALRIADAEGIDAVSMRRVAEELDAGTMTLYHYVRTKAELLALLSDAVMGEYILPDEALTQDWRAVLTAIAVRSRATIKHHPWLLTIVEQPSIGPNSIRHVEQSLQAVAELGLDLSARLDIIRLVDEYVVGFCFFERDVQQLATMTASDRDDLSAYLVQMSATGDYPQLASLINEHGMDALWRELDVQERGDTRFIRNLHRLFDGIEHSLPRHETR